MAIEIHFLARREERVVFFKYFTIADLAVFLASFLPPMLLDIFVNLPFYWGIWFCTPPVLFGVLYFRYNRPKGFFFHWLNWTLRPRFWYMGRSKDRTLIGKSSRFPEILIRRTQDYERAMKAAAASTEEEE